MQTSTTKRPDALKAQEHGLKVLEYVGFQCRPVKLGNGLKQCAWGGSSKPKFVVNGACLASAVDHENSVKNHNFVMLATNKCILDDFRHKSHQKQSLDRLKMVFFTEKAPH